MTAVVEGAEVLWGAAAVAAVVLVGGAAMVASELRQGRLRAHWGGGGAVLVGTLHAPISIDYVRIGSMQQMSIHS